MASVDMATIPPKENDADCHKCKKSLNGSRAIHADNKRYHPECFSCHVCSKRLTSKYFKVEGEPYCQQCWCSKFAPKCKGCGKSIEDGEYVTLLGNDFHKDCARCTKCQKTLAGDQYFPFKEEAYCYDCHWKVRNEIHLQRQLQQQTVPLKKADS